MLKDLRYDYMTANFAKPPENRHAQVVMKELGITYQYGVPQSLGDLWWFLNCKQVPEELPEFITELEVDLQDCVGHGLSQAMADKLEGNKNE